MEYGTQCFCGNALSPYAQLTTQAGCAMSCLGNSMQICGDSNRLSVYANGTPVQMAVPVLPAVVGNYNVYQCMTEATSGRALSGPSYTDTTGMTLESCAKFCDGYLYFGLEYSQECYCGSYFNAGSKVAPGTDCSMLCSGNATQLCGAGARLSTYQLRSDASVSVISQAPPGSTPTTSPGSVAPLPIPVESACPATNGQTLTDVDGANYTIHCSSDSTTTSYTSTQAAQSYLDCMSACNAASSSGCLGFTYVGAANGRGPGTCYLKSISMGSYIAAGSNLVSGSLVGASKIPSGSDVASPSSSSSATPTLTGYCPTANGQTITDSNGLDYVVHCSSDSSTTSYTSVAATRSYMDCMTACDAAKSTGCIGFTYVGGANGVGGGQCYLKSGTIGRYISSESSLISAVLASAASETATPPSTYTSAQRDYCPAANGQSVTDANGFNYTVTCSSDSSTGSYTSVVATRSYLDCMGACDSASSTGCVGFTYVGGANGFGTGQCYLKSGSIGDFIPRGSDLISAVLVGSGNNVAPPGATSTATATAVSTSFCPSSNGTIVSDPNGFNYTVRCSSDSTINSYGSAPAASSYLDCMTACDGDMTNNCTGAVYVGSVGGGGPGICYLKRNMGDFFAAGANLIAIAREPN